VSKDGLRFDWYPILQADFIDDLATEVMATIEVARTSTRGSSPTAAEVRTQQQLTIAKHLLSALYCAYSAVSSKKAPTLVSVIKKTNGFSTDKTKYPSRIHYSFRSFSDVYDALNQLNWISIDEGKQGVGYTRIHAKNRLKSTFKAIGLIWTKQQPKSLEDLIVLRDRIETIPNKPRHSKASKKYKKITLETPDTPEVTAMAESLYSYNEFLTHHCLSIDATDSELYDIAKALAGNTTSDNDEDIITNLDFSRVQLRRIFSRGDLNKHGRFYNGWWQSVPSIYRQHITIDGYKTSEVDYSNMSLRIVYALQGIERDVDDDLYDIGLDNWLGGDDPRRKLIKVFVNALMNDETGNYKLKKPELRTLGLTHEELLALVLKAHEPIADKLTDGIGLYSTYLDSQIAELVMTTMQEDGIVALPIHDSFLVRTGYQQWLEVVMEAAFRAVTGATIATDADGPRLSKHFGMSKDRFKEVEKEHNQDESSGIFNVSTLDYETLFKDTTMKKYLSYWEQWRLEAEQRL
tara:strand:- start:898 stop:2457 length:1560 start_codon:yes stop_codon:yes gene_type:complete